MKTKSSITILTLMLMITNIFGQSPLDKKIKIDVNIIGLQNNEKYYLNSVNKAGVDSALVNDGTLSFSYTGEPNAFTISSKPDNGSDGSDITLTVFIAGENDIKINGHIDSLQNIKIAGSKIDNEMKEFNKEIILPLETAYNSIPFSETTKRDSLKNKIKSSYTTFIRKHSSSYTGLLSLYMQIQHKEYTEEEATNLLELFENKYKRSYYFTASSELLVNVKQIEIGKQAPNFSSRDLENNAIKLSDYRGKYVLLEFWSSWCGPCLHEMPGLVETYNKYKKEGFEIIGISLDTNNDTWKKTIKEKNLLWTQITDLKGWRNDVATLYCVDAIPRSFLINPVGKIIEKNLRSQQLTEKLEEIFKK